MYSLRQKVVWFAISTRFLILVLQCISNAVIPDHDAQDVFTRPMPQTVEKKFLDKLVGILLGGLERWDAQYFLHIAEHGYVYENTLAFFPLFPIAVRFLTACLNLVTGGLLAQQSLLLLASVSLNMVCFVKAADALFCLSLRVLENEVLAYKAALLFCINPASIFFSAPYSEALFVLLAFQGMRHSIDQQYSKLCAIPFGLAAAARSNGVLNIGYILHGSIQQFISEEWTLLSRKKGFTNKLLLPFKIMPALFRVTESCIIALAPFIAYQIYCYVLFCTSQKLNIPDYVIQHGKERGFVFPEYGETFQRSSDHWCHFRFPLAYSYVQDHYWNIGFLHYYQLKQIPNFLLAGPIVWLILSSSKKYFQEHKSLLCHLGFKTATVKKQDSLELQPKMSSKMFVFVVHVVFLTFFCLIFVHIQVATRMICSASPVPYWYAAYLYNFKQKKGSNHKARDGKMLVTSQLKKLYNKKASSEDPKAASVSAETLDNLNSKWRVIILSKVPDNKGKIILLYFFSYTLIGTIMFSNFLPWT